MPGRIRRGKRGKEARPGRISELAGSQFRPESEDRNQDEPRHELREPD